MVHPLDPRYINFVDYEYRIWGDDRGNRFARLDEEDYHWAIKWRWEVKLSKGGKKLYFYRIGFIGNLRTSLYLHVEIMKRTGIIQPSEHHRIVDHRDGDSFNCRRYNLRWATPRMNRQNLFGQFPHDLIEG